MLNAIPVEIVLAVLSFIPLRQLQRLREVSHEWNTFFAENESSIYHAAAILHDFVPLHASLTQCRAMHITWLAEVHTWKDLCRKHYAMESRWEAHGQARYASVSAAGGTIHRFKIDTEQRTVITTYFDGGLRVSGIDANERLWSLPRSAVSAWAHCEYDGGFLVFTRIGEAVEVWRRKRDSGTNPRPSGLFSDPHQQRAEQLSWQSQTSISQDDRGAFVPWTVIIPPNSVRALRLVFPILLLASHSAAEAYLYDVRMGTLVQTVPLRRSQDPPININYVELGARHIFICTDHDVLILPRDVAHSQAKLNFPSQAEDFDGLYAENTYTLSQVNDDDESPDSVPEALPTLQECPLELTRSVAPSRIRGFTGVHVTPCGSHFVATDMKGCLYLVRNFEEVIRGTLPMARCVVVLDLFHPITYLALDGDKRVCIHVQDRGVFVVPFVSTDTPSVDSFNMEPGKSHPRLLRANRVGLYSPSPCIQLTRTELWTKKCVDTELGIGLIRLFYLDFTKPQ